MQTSAWQKDENWNREAGMAGLSDLEEFDACVSGDDVRRRLSRQKALADSLNVGGTPTFVSPRGVHRGVATLSQVVELLAKQ